jgi:hypothetical protein
MANTPPLALNASPASPPPLIDRQGWWNLLAGMLLILISFTTNFSDGDLHDFSTLALNDQIAICLHLAALAALAGDVELASRLRHRARNREVEARGQAIEREQRQNRSLRAGALFLLDPNPLHRRFLAYVANELAGIEFQA